MRQARARRISSASLNEVTTDRAARHIRRDVRQSPPHQYDPARSVAGHVALHLGRVDAQEAEEGEVGSSAAAAQGESIDFENAEGNFGVANALFERLSSKLPVSRKRGSLGLHRGAHLRRWPRAFAHRLWRAGAPGFGKAAVNEQALRDALLAHPEVLAEAIQTVLRVADVEMPYEKLKALTRGKQVTLEKISRSSSTASISAAGRHG